MDSKLLGASAAILLACAAPASAEWPPGTATPQVSSVGRRADSAHALASAAAVNRSVALDRCATMSGDERLTCNEQAMQAARLQSGNAAAASVQRANALARCGSMAGDERAHCEAQAARDATLQAGIEGSRGKAPK